MFFLQKYLDQGGTLKKYLVSEGSLKNTSPLEFYPLKILLSSLSVYVRSTPPGAGGQTFLEDMAD